MNVKKIGQSLATILPIIFTIIAGLFAYYQWRTSQQPNLTVAIRQDKRLLSTAPISKWMHRDTKADNPITVIVDEANAPEAVAITIEQILLFLQDNIINRTRDMVANSLQRDVLLRSVTDRHAIIAAQAQLLYPQIKLDLDVANSGGPTVLWLANATLDWQSPLSTNTLTQEIDIGDDRRVDAVSEKSFKVQLLFPINDIVNVPELGVDAITNLLSMSETARSNFCPFVEHVANYPNDNINSVMMSAPLFAHPEIFSSFVDRFRSKLYKRLFETTFTLTIELTDSHNNEYRATLPIEIELKQGVHKPEDWVIVSVRSIHAIREMNERMRALGLKSRKFCDLFGLATSTPNSTASGGATTSESGLGAEEASGSEVSGAPGSALNGAKLR